MTTLFEEADNTNPPSPSLELLDTPTLKNELEPTRKVSTNTSASVEIRSDAVGQSNRSTTSPNLGGDTFTPFVNDPNQIPSGVRVVHVQTVPEGTNQNSGGVTGQTNVSSGGALYTVGSGGQIQQVMSPSEPGGLATVAVDANASDGSRYTYYPAVQSSDGNQAGQFYVMMSPQDVIPVTGNSGPRIIAPRSQNLTQLGDGTFAVEASDEPIVQFRKVETTRSSRDERRRATHNEVERRRRDKINTWIMKLAAVIPDCQMDQSKQGTSKGGVLSKALDHIIKLRTENDRMRETIKEQERILVENQVLRQQVEKLRQENAILQANLQLRQSEHEQMEQEAKPLESD